MSTFANFILDHIRSRDLKQSSWEYWLMPDGTTMGKSRNTPAPFGSLMKAFVRYEYMYVDKKFALVININNMSVAPEQRGKGIFKDFLMSMEGCTDFELLYIQNVGNPRLANHLNQREGWLADRDSFFPEAVKGYYRPLRHPWGSEELP